MELTVGNKDICEFSGDPDHDYCKHCGTCFTCLDEHNDQLADKCNQLNIALCKAQEKIQQLEKACNIKDQEIEKQKGYVRKFCEEKRYHYQEWLKVKKILNSIYRMARGA